jgi:hypothetical protein
VFKFPTDYKDTGQLGDRLWNNLMPSIALPSHDSLNSILIDAQVGAGFLRVPFPRTSGLPPSKPIPNDHEFAEIYSISITHQLHCLVGKRVLSIAKREY